MSRFKKLALSMLGMLVIAAVLLMLLYERVAVAPVQDLIQSHMKMMADASAYHINEWLDGIIRQLAIVSTHPDLRSQNDHLIESQLNAIVTSDSDYVRLVLADTTGRVLDRSIEANLADRPYFVQAVGLGQPVIGELVISRLTGEPVIPIAHPVRDRSGAITGVLVATIGLEVVQREVVGGILIEGTTSIFQSDGQVVATSSPMGSASNGLRRDHHPQQADLVYASSIPIADWTLQTRVRTDTLMIPIRSMETYIVQMAIVLVGLATGVTALLLFIQKQEIKEIGLARYQLLCRHARDIMLFVAPDGRIIEANLAAVGAYGYRSKELLAMSIHDLQPEHEVSLTSQQLALARLDGMYFEAVHQRKDGSSFPVEVSIQGATLDGKPMLLCVIRDLSERKEAEERLRYLSIHDRLTGLHNRAYFDDALAQIDARNELPFSIVMGDLNDLKLVNDTQGHEEGDKLLCRVAAILKEASGAEDIVTRIGGDEFIIIMPLADEGRASDLIARVRAACRCASHGYPAPSIALGSATKTTVEQPVSEVLREAERMMYCDKRARVKSIRISRLGD